jgi:hypothetical protein
LKQCGKTGIKKIGFTGGEPFLCPGFLSAVIKEASRNNISFSRIVTNGVWYKNRNNLSSALKGICKAGYEGEICISIDAFHRQNAKKIIVFIKKVFEVFRRNDIISIAYVLGAMENETKIKLLDISKRLRAKLINFGKNNAHIKGEDFFIRLYKINLTAVGKAAKLKNHWDGQWFREDYCLGPGHIFNVMPNGDVAPCCGYASENRQLNIGNINRDTPETLIRKAEKNPIVSGIFNNGLGSIRRVLEKNGIKFSKKTSNHCFFCWYILNSVKIKNSDFVNFL